MKLAQIHFTFIAKTLAIGLIFLAASAVILRSEIYAETGINRTINFQGKLINNPAKTNVTDTTYTVVFTIYDAPSGGTALWSETQSVTTADGIFRVALGSVTPIPSDINFNWSDMFLGIRVNADSEMTPRVQLAAVPYAFNAEKVAGLTVQDTSGNASTSGILRVGNGTTINLGNNNLTFTTSGGTTLTLPTTGTLATLAGVEILTNKTIGSTGLTFSGATTDITTATDEDFTLTPNGIGNIVLFSDADSGVTIGSAISNEFPLLVRSGIGNNATVVVDNLNSGDLISASASGTTRFVVENDGNILVDAGQGLDTLVAGALNLGTTNATSAVLGSSSLDSFTITTNSTGDSEVALPAQSIGSSEIVNNSLDFTKVASALTLDEDTTVSLSTFNYIFDLTSTGDFLIRDAGSNIAQFLDDGTISLGKSAAAGTLSLGAGTGADVINIGSDNTTGDTLTIGNNNASTTLSLTGGTAWSITSAGAAALTSISGAGLSDCDTATSKLLWNDASGTFSCGTDLGSDLQLVQFRDTTQNASASFTSVADMWNGTYPNLNPSDTTNVIQVSITVLGTGDDNSDATGVFSVRRAIGTNPTCTDTQVGGNFAGSFTTTSGQSFVAAATFRDAPASTGNVRYTVCTTATGVDDGNVDEITVVLTEIGSGGGAGGGSTVNVRESDGSPSVASTSTLEFGEGSSSEEHFIVSDQGGGVARVQVGSQIGILNQAEIVTGGWTFNTASTNFTTSILANGGLSTTSNSDLTLSANGVGNVLINPNAGGDAALIVDKLGVNDIFTASASGTTRFIIGEAGDIGLTGGFGSTGQCLQSNGAGFAATWEDCTSGASGSWTISDASGTITPLNNTVDLLVGGAATTSAKFAILNVNEARGNQIASISGSLVLDSIGSLTTTNNQTLTLGGSDTGNIVIDSGSYTITLSDDTTISQNLNIGGTTGLSFSTTGGINLAGGTIIDSSDEVDINDDLAVAGTTGISLTGAGADLIFANLERISNDTNGTITIGRNDAGTVTLNAADDDSTAAFNILSGGAAALTLDTGAAATLNLGNTNSNNIVIGNTGSTTSITLTKGSSGNIALTGFNCSSGYTNGGVLTTDGSGNIVCQDDDGGASAFVYIDENQGALHANNFTLDFLLGSDATSSAKFAFKNVLTGTPTASISAITTDNALFIDANGNIQTTNAQSLTLGGGDSGDVYSASTLRLDATNGIKGGGLSDCDNPTTAKLLWDASTNRFSCGTDQGGGGGSSITVRESDSSPAVSAIAVLEFGPGTTSSDEFIITDEGSSTSRVRIGNQVGMLNQAETVTGGWTFNTAATTFSTEIVANGGISSTTNTDISIVPNGTGKVIINPNAGGQAALIVNKLGNNDIFTASASGATRFSVNNNGNIQFLGNGSALNTITTSGGAGATYTFPSSSGTVCLSTNNCTASTYWQLNANALSPGNSTYDLLLGGSSTTAAKFAFIGSAGNISPVASISATTDSGGNGNGLVLGAGSIQSLRRNTLTLGGSSTGNIILSPNNGTDGVLSLNSSNINTNATTLTLFNTSPTTVNAFAGAASLNLGASAGTLTLGNGGASTLRTTTGGLTINSGSNTLTIDSTDTTLTASGLANITTAATLTFSGNLAANGTTGLTLSGSGADLVFANGESITNDTNSSITLRRNDAGIVTLTAADNDATAEFTIQSGGAAALNLSTGGAAGINIGTTNANAVTVGNTTTGTGLTFNSGTGGINIGNNANTKTINIGGNGGTNGSDTVNIATDASTGDFITIGNANASSTLAVTGGTSWSVTSGGAATFNTLSGAGLTTCNGSTQKLLWNGGSFSCGTDQTGSAAPVTRTTNSTTSTSIGTAETSVLSVSITPSSSTADIWAVGVVAIQADSNTDRTVTGRVRRGASCAAGTLVGGPVAIVTDVGGDRITLAVSVVDTNPGASAQTYHLCVQTGAGSPTAEGRSLTVQEIDAGADLGEIYYSQSPIEPGTVVTLDSSLVSGVKPSEKAYDSSVMGVVSTRPGLLLGGEGENQGHATILALKGRVPVKVSLEGGEIKAGDFLTSSTIPGVAMKAVKSGSIIGVAMQDFSGEGVGKIMVYVQDGNTTGSIAGILINPEIDLDSPEFGEKALNALKTQESSVSGLIGSQIATDILIATTEIVTPKITVDELYVNKLKAGEIEGLETINSKIAALETKVATIGATLSENNAKFDQQDKLIQLLTSELENATTSATEAQVGLAGLSINTSSVSGNLRVQGNGLFEGILNVVDTLTSNNFIANSLATFFGDAIFKAKVAFEGPVTFASDMGGVAVIEKDDRRVEVIFEEEFEQNPIVNVSVSFDEKLDEEDEKISTKKQEDDFFKEDYSYIIVNKSKKGFTIVLNKAAEDNVNFTWTAINVKDSKTIQSRLKD